MWYVLYVYMVYGCGVLLTSAVCLVVCGFWITWGMVCLSVLLGTAEVSVLLCMRILFKFLIHRFVNGVPVVDIKFSHMYFLFTGCSIFQDFRNFPFLTFLIIGTVLSIFPYACPVSCMRSVISYGMDVFFVSSFKCSSCLTNIRFLGILNNLIGRWHCCYKWYLLLLIVLVVICILLCCVFYRLYLY
jgi:hypothetical protein